MSFDPAAYLKSKRNGYTPRVRLVKPVRAICAEEVLVAYAVSLDGSIVESFRGVWEDVRIFAHAALDGAAWRVELHGAEGEGCVGLLLAGVATPDGWSPKPRRVDWNARRT